MASASRTFRSYAAWIALIRSARSTAVFISVPQICEGAAGGVPACTPARTTTQWRSSREAVFLLVCSCLRIDPDWIGDPHPLGLVHTHGLLARPELVVSEAECSCAGIWFSRLGCDSPVPEFRVRNGGDSLVVCSVVPEYSSGSFRDRSPGRYLA